MSEADIIFDPEIIKCQSCNCVIENPYQCRYYNHYRVCYSHIARRFRNTDHYFEDLAMKRDLDNITMRCGVGCNWTGSMKNLIAHNSECASGIRRCNECDGPLGLGHVCPIQEWCAICKRQVVRQMHVPGGSPSSPGNTCYDVTPRQDFPLDRVVRAGEAFAGRYSCPICYSCFKPSRQTSCGHRFCVDCSVIEGNCPMCRSVMTSCMDFNFLDDIKSSRFKCRECQPDAADDEKDDNNKMSYEEYQQHNMEIHRGEDEPRETKAAPNAP